MTKLNLINETAKKITCADCVQVILWTTKSGAQIVTDCQIDDQVTHSVDLHAMELTGANMDEIIAETCSGFKAK